MTDRELMQQALEALVWGDTYVCAERKKEAITVLRDRLERPEQMTACPHGVPHRWPCEICEPVEQPPQQEKLMPITDDHGQALRPQYRVIEQRGQWQLLYDQYQLGNVARHEFRIQKLTHDIALYPGITLTEAQKRFREKVESDSRGNA